MDSDPAALPLSQRSPVLSHAHLKAPSRRLSVTSKERQKLIASIESSSRERPVVDFDIPQYCPQVNGDDSNLNKILPQDRTSSASNLGERPRDPRDEPVYGRNGDAAYVLGTESGQELSRPHGTKRPIDFDGLSWPSKLCFGIVIEPS